MEIIIDQKSYTGHVPEGSFTELMNSLIADCVQQGRLVTTVMINGDPLPAVSEEIFETKVREDVHTLELITAETRGIAISVLRQCSLHIPILVNALIESSQHLREGNLSQGMGGVEQAFNLWLDLSVGTERALMILGFDLTDIPVILEKGITAESTNALDILKKINSLLVDTQKTIENKDMIELSDLLEVDFPPLLTGFQRGLEDIANKLHGAEK